MDIGNISLAIAAILIVIIQTVSAHYQTKRMIQRDLERQKTIRQIAPDLALIVLKGLQAIIENNRRQTLRDYYTFKTLQDAKSDEDKTKQEGQQ